MCEFLTGVTNQRNWNIIGISGQLTDTVVIILTINLYEVKALGRDLNSLLSNVIYSRS